MVRKAPRIRSLNFHLISFNFFRVKYYELSIFRFRCYTPFVFVIRNQDVNILWLERNWWKINKIHEHWVQRKYESMIVWSLHETKHSIELNQNGILSTVISAEGNKIELNWMYRMAHTLIYNLAIRFIIMSCHHLSNTTHQYIVLP